MIRRARLIGVVTVLATGALGLVSSTQTWLEVTLSDGAQHPLAVPGASAVPVLAPLSLAVLALGLALAIVGAVLRYVFGVLTVAIAGLLAWQTAQIAVGPPVSAITSTVTEATGITGESAVASLVSDIDVTGWPFIALGAWIILVAAGIVVLVTAHAWSGSGRRFRTSATARAAASTPPRAAGSRPHDAADSTAIDSWDDLSRGEDPTA